MCLLLAPKVYLVEKNAILELNTKFVLFKTKCWIMIISYDDPVWAPCSGLANENRKWIFTSGSVVNSMVARRVVTHVWASCRTIFLIQVVFPDPGIKRCQKCNLLQLSIHQCDPGSRRSHVFPAVTVEWFCSNSEIFILFIFKNNCQFLCFPIYFFAIFYQLVPFLA